MEAGLLVGGARPIIATKWIFCLQWNPSKVDNLEPHSLSIIVGCPLWRGCIDVNGKTIGTQKFVRYIEVSVIEGCPLSRVSIAVLSSVTC